MVEAGRCGARVAFVAGTLAQGGAEKQLFYILQTLRSRGYDLLLLCLTQGDYWQEQIQALGVPVVWVGMHQSRLLRLFEIYRHIRRFSPQLIQSQHFFVNIYVALVGHWLSIPHVGAIRNDLTSEVASNGIYGRWCLNLPEYLVANSKPAMNKSMSMGAKSAKVFYLPNVIDCEMFTPGQHTSSTRIRVLSVGTFKKQKNYDLFVQICAELRRRLDIRAVLVGDGPESAHLREKARVLGMEPDILHFAGRAQDVLPFYHDADVFLLTSDWEGTPNVLMEAMACGLPVVTTRVGGAGDLIEDGVSGFLIEPDANACAQFVRVITRLASDQAMREQVGRNARRRIVERNDRALLGKYLDDIYSQVTDAQLSRVGINLA